MKKHNQNSRWGRRFGWVLTGGFGFCLLLVSCQSVEWVEVEGGCAKVNDGPPLRRVINYADPDLCGRRPPAGEITRHQVRTIVDKYVDQE